jgi:hypothetical protein
MKRLVPVGTTRQSRRVHPSKPSEVGSKAAFGSVHSRVRVDELHTHRAGYSTRFPVNMSSVSVVQLRL